MNTKEEIIQILKDKVLNTIRFGHETEIQKLESLITATEAAIFDVPNEAEEEKELLRLIEKNVTREASFVYCMGWNQAKIYFLNYKKI